MSETWNVTDPRKDAGPVFAMKPPKINLTIKMKLIGMRRWRLRVWIAIRFFWLGGKIFPGDVVLEKVEADR